jgi:hypothetical protein
MILKLVLLAVLVVNVFGLAVWVVGNGRRAEDEGGYHE